MVEGPSLLLELQGLCLEGEVTIKGLLAEPQLGLLGSRLSQLHRLS